MKFIKNLIAALLLTVFIPWQAFAQPQTDAAGINYGFMMMGGGRYDDVRMCVASAAGVKGGPIADIMFSVRQPVGKGTFLIYNLPVMRPVLFALAFEMLQFEPEIEFLMNYETESKRVYFHGPGLGLSLNYGPDYLSDQENRGDSFFSAGPMLQYQGGIYFKADKTSSLSIKAFYIPLFSRETFPNGTVLGGSIQYSYYF